MFKKLNKVWKESREKSRIKQKEAAEEWAILKREINKEHEEKVERERKRKEREPKLKLLLNSIDREHYPTDEDHKTALKEHLLNPLGEEGYSFQIDEYISISEKNCRMEFLIDDTNKQFIVFDLNTVPHPLNQSKIYKFSQISGFKLVELGTGSTGSEMINALMINVFIKKKQQSKIKLPEPDIVFPLMPDEELMRLRSKIHFSKVKNSIREHLPCKKTAEKIMHALSYMKNNP